MKPFIYHSMALLVVAMVFMLTACHETKYLEDTLYVGIADISYNKPSEALSKARAKLGHWTPDSTSEGFITAEYKAMQNIIDNLSLHGSEEGRTMVTDAALRDSLAREQKRIDAEQQDVRTEVDAVLSYAPNNSLFGSSSTRWPLPIGLWAYNKYVGAKHRFGKWMFNTFAATPRYMTSANPKARAQVATNTLHNFGFFRGEVEYDTIPVGNPRKSKLAYSVYPHELFRLDSIEYVNFTPQEDSLIVAHWNGTLLHRDDPFQARNLQAERERLNDLFQNNGFFYHQPQHIAFRADTTRVPERVQLQVMPARDVPEEAKQRYYIGRTTVRALEYGHAQPTDSMQMRDGSLFCWNGAKSPIRYGALRHWLFYMTDPKDLPASMLGKAGQRLRLANPRIYNKKLMGSVHEKLLGMGCFSQVSMNYVLRDTSYLCDTLDVVITAVLDKPYNAEFRGDVTSKSNGLVGPGVGFSFTKKNAFCGAESLSVDAYASYEWMTGADVKGNAMSINSYEYGASLNLIYPKLKFFNLLRRLNRYASASTTFDVKADWLNRSGYYSRATFGFGVRYNYQRRRYVKHELTPFNLDYNVQLSSSDRFDSLVNANRALGVSMRNQFVPSMQYTLQMSSRSTARNSRTFTLTAKEAGNVVSGLYAAFGQSFQQRDKHLFGVPFAQYFKLSAQYTQQFRLGSTNACLAGRVYGGFVKSFGNSLMAPYNDLFSIGGANSIRAFSVRTIGPGAYKPSQSGYSYIDQVGDLKFEANVEVRFPIVSSLYGAAFVDAGNVWLLDPDKEKPGASFNPRTLGRELALGTGVGLRYDLDIMVIRFDVGVGIHAPYDTGRSGYYNMTSFGRSLGYHLAVGYPF